MLDFDDILDDKFTLKEEDLGDDEVVKKLERSNGFPFSEEQLNVVRDFGRPLSVVACAGAGKTSVMVSKMIYMEQVYKVKASTILGISFNKEAVTSLKQRYKELRKGMGLSTIVMPSFNTFHSLFYSLLRSVSKYRGYGFATEGEYMYKLIKKVKQTNSDEGNKKVLEDYFNIRGKLINEGYNEVYRSIINGSVKSTGISYLNDIDMQNFVLVMSTYEAIKEERRELDFEDMQLLLYEEVVINDNEDITARFRSVYDYVFIDEYQDINSIQIQLMDALIGKDKFNNLVTVGDSDQCQPPNTLVSTSKGQVRIDTLEDGDKVLAWDRVNNKLVDNSKVKVAKRDYEGMLYTLRINGKETRATPNHKFLVKWANTTSNYVVYLMYREDKGYILNYTQLFSDEGVNHLALITKEEGAEKVWVLSEHENLNIAYRHALISRYNLGITSRRFKEVDKNGKKYKLEGSRKYVNVYEDLPFLTKDNVDDFIYKTNNSFEVYTSNIMGKSMTLPIPNNNGYTDELIGKVSFEYYKGLVYSLDVEKHHSYVSDGIVTLNSIYQFRGSNPDYIVNFILNYENAQRMFLGSNYRCKSNILEDIIPSITRNKVRVDYDMKAFNEGGEVIQVVGDDDKFIAELEKDLAKTDEETVILVRLLMQQKILADLLIENDIDVKIKSEKSTVRNDIIYKDIMNIIRAIKYRDAELMKYNSHKIFPFIKRTVWDDIINYDKDWVQELVENPEYKIDETLRKNIYKLEEYTKAKNMIVVAYKLLRNNYKKMAEKSYVSMKDVELVVKHMIKTSYDLSLEDFLKRERLKESRLIHNFENDIGINIKTMHSVKGLEYDNVYLYGLDNTIIPNERRMKHMGTTEKEGYVEEERRLFYVAWTRAKSRLVYHYTDEESKSMFINEIRSND